MAALVAGRPAEGRELLAEALAAIRKAAPADPGALVQHGYVSKSFAQVAEAQGSPQEADRYYEEAKRVFEAVIRLDSQNASAHNGLGNVLYGLGELDGAINAHRRALRLEPGYPQAH